MLIPCIMVAEHTVSQVVSLVSFHESEKRVESVAHLLRGAYREILLEHVHLIRHLPQCGIT